MTPLSTELIITLQQLEGIGNKTIMKIIEKIPTHISSLPVLTNFWSHIKGKKFEAITAYDLREANNIAKRIIEKSENEGLNIITYYDDIYPDILRNCVDESGKLDPPLVLYCRGDLNALTKPGIAVIGTREPSTNGVKAGEYFAGEFAKRGYNIVSGLAIGCDTSGHRGALNVGGTTTAFLANGLDWNSIYPKENLELAKEIVEKGGLLLSEYPIGQNCGRYGLVARDRLQAGLSIATIVIQTDVKGGTMHAVNATIASHKPVFAVEYGANTSDASYSKTQGNKWLIKMNKAFPLRSKEFNKVLELIEHRTGNSTIQTSLFPEI